MGARFGFLFLGGQGALLVITSLLGAVWKGLELSASFTVPIPCWRKCSCSCPQMFMQPQRLPSVTLSLVTSVPAAQKQHLVQVRSGWGQQQLWLFSFLAAEYGRDREEDIINETLGAGWSVLLVAERKDFSYPIPWLLLSRLNAGESSYGFE